VDVLRPLWSFFSEHLAAIAFAAALIDATGVPFPGRLVLVVTGALAAGDRADVRVLIGLAALGAVIGDHVWFLAGRLGGKAPLRWYCRFTLGSRRCVDRASGYYRRFGGGAIVVGRFVAGVRFFTAPLAGAGLIPYRQFLLFEILGAALWAGMLVGGGYFLGDRAVDVVADSGWAMGVLGALGIGAMALPIGQRLWRRGRYGPAVLG
jgi:membrane protein DedA with SNARE-associated domain